MLWDSKIQLSEPFFNVIITHPVPIDMNTLKALKRSTLGLDLYLWLTYRTFALRAPLRLTWQQLYRQFWAHSAKASDKFTVHAFRYKVLLELKKIKMAWPYLHYTTPHRAWSWIQSIMVGINASEFMERSMEPERREGALTSFSQREKLVSAKL